MKKLTTQLKTEPQHTGKNRAPTHGGLIFFKNFSQHTVEPQFFLRSRVEKNCHKPKKNYFIHIHTTFNNTLINVTNFKGDTIAWASGGSIGFKNSRKKGSFVARQVGYALGKKCRKKKIKHVQVKVKGLGYSKKNAIRGIKSSGIKITEIHEITGIPYNGCRLRKKRR